MVDVTKPDLHVCLIFAADSCGASLKDRPCAKSTGSSLLQNMLVFLCDILELRLVEAPAHQAPTQQLEQGDRPPPQELPLLVLAANVFCDAQRVAPLDSSRSACPR